MDVDADMVEAWRSAADDLGIEVIAPARVGDLTGIAHVTSFGGPRGTIVIRLGGQNNGEIIRAAKSLGYYISINNGDVYQTYDRQVFIGTLDDWGWFGDPQPPPLWYTGTPWGA